jgi:methanogenic corrinoid protein MtbC1
MDADVKILAPDALRQFESLRTDAVAVVTERFYAAHGSAYADAGSRGRESCREDIAYHLEFLHPVLEFGYLRSMVDYLRWLASVLAARFVPVEHIALSLDLLAAFFAEHMNATDGATVSAALRAARTQFLEAKGALPLSCHEPWPEAEPFGSALLAGQQHKALSIMNRCIDTGHSLLEVEQYVIKPALYQIGEGWQTNQVTVASEHLATAIAQSVMTVGLLRSPPPETVGKRVLLACVAGNEHAVGLRMVADAFQLAGWDAHYLGANAPTLAIVRHAEEWKPDLIGLSVSFAQQLRSANQVIRQLGERLGSSRPAVIIGGLAINRFDRLAEMVGADGFSPDAPSAVTAASQLVSG